MENKLKAFLRSDEYSTLYEKANLLKEDIEFFTLFMKRNSCSGFSFGLSIRKGMCVNLIDDLYSSYYRYNLDELSVMLTEYYVAKRLIENLGNGDGELFSRSTQKEIVKYFKKNHDIDLVDYVDDFIGCSMGCSIVQEKLSKLQEG